MADNKIKNNLSQTKANPNKRENDISSDLINKIKKNPTLVREVFMGVMQGPAINPIYEKITSSHITQTLDIMSKEASYEYKGKNKDRKYKLFYIIFGVVVFIVLTIYLVERNNIDLLKEIVKIGGAALLGAIGGYGFNEYKKK